MPNSEPDPATARSGARLHRDFHRDFHRGFRVVTAADLDDLLARAGLTPEQALRTRAATAVLGLLTTSYVTEELIDRSAAPDDPIYRLTVPGDDAAHITDLLRQDAPKVHIDAAARPVRTALAADHTSPTNRHASAETMPGMCRAGH